MFTFLPADQAVRLGVLLVLLTPCVDYVIVFSGLAGASSHRLLAATPLLLIAQMLLLPLYLLLFLGPDLAETVEVGPVRRSVRRADRDPAGAGVGHAGVGQTTPRRGGGQRRLRYDDGAADGRDAVRRRRLPGAQARRRPRRRTRCGPVLRAVPGGHGLRRAGRRPAVPAGRRAGAAPWCSPARPATLWWCCRWRWPCRTGWPSRRRSSSPRRWWRSWAWSPMCGWCPDSSLRPSIAGRPGPRYQAASFFRPAETQPRPSSSATFRAASTRAARSGSSSGSSAASNSWAAATCGRKPAAERR